MVLLFTLLVSTLSLLLAFVRTLSLLLAFVRTFGGTVLGRAGHSGVHGYWLRFRRRDRHRRLLHRSLCICVRKYN